MKISRRSLLSGMLAAPIAVLLIRPADLGNEYRPSEAPKDPLDPSIWQGPSPLESCPLCRRLRARRAPEAIIRLHYLRAHRLEMFDARAENLWERDRWDLPQYRLTLEHQMNIRRFVALDLGEEYYRLISSTKNCELSREYGII